MINNRLIISSESLLPIFLFILLFGPKLFGTPLDLISLASLILILIWWQTAGHLGTNILILFSLIFVGQIIFLIGGIVADGDIQHLMRPIRVIVNSLGIFILVKMYLRYYEDHAIDVFIQHMFTAFVIHACIMLLQYASSDFRDFIYFFTNPWDIVNRDMSIISGTRILGLTYGLASSSVLQLTGILLFLYLQSTGQVESRSYWFGLILIFLSILISGRSGLFIALLLIPIYFLMKRKDMVRNITYFITLFISLYWLIIVFLPEFCDDNFCGESISVTLWHMEELFGIFLTGSSATISHLINELKLPSDLMTIFFGGAKTPIDSGYFKDIYFAGIGFLFLSIVVYTIPMILGLLSKSVDDFTRIVIFIFLAAIIFHFKEIGFFVRGLWTVHLSLLIFLLSRQSTGLAKRFSSA